MTQKMKNFVHQLQNIVHISLVRLLMKPTLHTFSFHRQKVFCWVNICMLLGTMLKQVSPKHSVNVIESPYYLLFCLKIGLDMSTIYIYLFQLLSSFSHTSYKFVYHPAMDNVSFIFPFCLQHSFKIIHQYTLSSQSVT